MSANRIRQIQQLIAQAQALIATCESQLTQTSFDRVSLRHTIEDAREKIEEYEEELAELDPLGEAGRIITLTAENFSEEAIRSDLPILIDFWAEWCGPCQQLIPILTELSREFDGKVKFGKLNVDETPSIAAQLDIQSLPALIILNNRQVVDLIIGVPAPDQLRARLERIVKK